MRQDRHHHEAVMGFKMQDTRWKIAVAGAIAIDVCFCFDTLPQQPDIKAIRTFIRPTVGIEITDKPTAILFDQNDGRAALISLVLAAETPDVNDIDNRLLVRVPVAGPSITVNRANLRIDDAVRCRQIPGVQNYSYCSIGSRMTQSWMFWLYICPPFLILIA